MMQTIIRNPAEPITVPKEKPKVLPAKPSTPERPAVPDPFERPGEAPRRCPHWDPKRKAPAC